MEYRQIGKSEVRGSSVVLGAWAIGGWMWGGQSDSESIRAIHAALDAGINFIDTAAVYGFGRSEEVVGKAISDRRQNVVIATKCGLRWSGEEPRKGQYYFSSNERGLQSDDSAKYEVYRYLGPESIRWEVEQSLRRLGIDEIDLYQTHWQDKTTPIEDTMDALLKLKDEGKIRAIGASNASVEQLQKYLAAGPLDSDQEQYSMLDRKPESGSIPFCRKHNIAFLAYSPLANGLLTGKIGPDRTFAEGDLRKGSQRFSVENRQRVSSLLDRFRPLAEEEGITLAQLVLAWTLHQPGITHVLAGIRNVEQARTNAAAGHVKLNSEQLQAMEEALSELGDEII